MNYAINTLVDYIWGIMKLSSQRCLPQILLKIPVPERHIRRPKIRRLQRIPRRLGQALPRHQRLLPALHVRETHLVVDGEDVVVLDQRPAFGAQRRAGAGLEAAVAGRGDAEERGRRGGRRVEPDDDALPVVAVAEPGAGRVFGEVPRVHDGVRRAGRVGGGAGADVDLAGAAGAGARGGAGGVEAGAVEGRRVSGVGGVGAGSCFYFYLYFGMKC